MAAASEVRPGADELEAIRQFCALEVHRKKTAEQVSADLKTLRDELKTIKASLSESSMKGLLCICVSKADAKRLEDLAAKNGVPSMPPFLRKLQTNKDQNITPDIIKEAIETITEESLREAAEKSNSGGTSIVLREAILKNIRLLIRGHTESLRLVPNIQRGTTTYDIPEASTPVADQMFRMWTLDHLIRQSLASKKPDPEMVKQQAVLKQRVEAFFVRTALSAQRLVVEGKQYRLVRRISVRKPKVGIGRLEKILDDVLKDFAESNRFRPAELARALQIQVSSVAPESKSTVSLCAVKAPAIQEDTS